ncbi:MAG: AsmA family protein [Candidatus Omnitrophica bacterium]|nr:AsmA family protein [Candidatus Omnitrophota bacterium]
MKKIFNLILILVVLIIGAVMARDLIVKKAIENIVSVTTGMKMDISQLKVSVPKTFVSIKGMTVLNPDNFKDRVMLDIPGIYIDYELRPLLKKRIHLQELRINLKEFTVVKNQDGKTNLEFIKNLKEKNKKSSGQKKKSSKPEIEIDIMSLKIGKVIYKDYSGGGGPIISEYRVNIDSTYKNVKDPGEIIQIITAKALMNTAIGRLTDFDQLKAMPANTIEQGKNLLKNTAGGLKNIITSPFK